MGRLFLERGDSVVFMDIWRAFAREEEMRRMFSRVFGGRVSKASWVDKAVVLTSIKTSI